MTVLTVKLAGLSSIQADEWQLAALPLHG